MFALLGGINHAKVIKEKIETQETLKKLKYLTCYDQLTGIYNRIFFEGEINRFNRTRQLPLSIIMADINGLKLINDAFGHDTGDEMLQNLRIIGLGNCVKSGESFGMIGGIGDASKR